MEMFASVMKRREGSAGTIKGMVMPTVKSLGVCGAPGTRGSGAETEQLQKDDFGESCVGREEEDVFIQLCGAAAIDRQFRESPVRRHLAAFQLVCVPFYKL